MTYVARAIMPHYFFHTISFIHYLFRTSLGEESNKKKFLSIATATIPEYNCLKQYTLY